MNGARRCEQGAGGQRQHRGFRRVVGIGREAERVAGAEDERAREIGVEVPVGDDGALRPAGGAGGEQDRGGVVLVDRGVGQVGSWCVIAKFGEVLLEHDERNSGSPLMRSARLASASSSFGVVSSRP